MPSASINQPSIPQELRPAFAIFLKELDGHLSFFKQVLAELAHRSMETEQDSEVLAGEQAKMLIHRFHVIKGGAGFFKLDEMRISAATGEKLFAHYSSSDNALIHITSQLEDIVRSFDGERVRLQTSFGAAGCALDKL